MIYQSEHVLIRDAEIEDVYALGNRLRQLDEQEIIAAGNTSGEAALKQSFERSTLCFCVVIDGRPAALFGIVPDTLVGSSANVWFLGADEMTKIKKTFVKLSRHFISLFLDQYPMIWNYVDVRYVSSIKWLKACGAQFENVLNINGNEFHSFVIRRA